MRYTLFAMIKFTLESKSLITDSPAGITPLQGKVMITGNSCISPLIVLTDRENVLDNILFEGKDNLLEVNQLSFTDVKGL